MTRTPVDNRVPACSGHPVSTGTRPPVPPVPACSVTHRNRHLTCANTAQTPLFHSHLVPLTQNRTTPKHVSAGQSVIHSPSYPSVTACSDTPGTALTCGNVLVPLAPKHENPCPTSVPPSPPTGCVRSRAQHALTRARSGPRQGQDNSHNSQPTATPGATR